MIVIAYRSGPTAAWHAWSPSLLCGQHNTRTSTHLEEKAKSKKTVSHTSFLRISSLHLSFIQSESRQFCVHSYTKKDARQLALFGAVVSVAEGSESSLSVLPSSGITQLPPFGRITCLSPPPFSGGCFDGTALRTRRETERMHGRENASRNSSRQRRWCGLLAQRVCK